MKATRMAFETRYSDDSGVDKAVRYGANLREQVQISSNGDTVSFLADDIDWLRDALLEIKSHLPERKKDPAC